MCRFNEAWAICRVVDKKDIWMELAKSALEHLEIELGVYLYIYSYYTWDLSDVSEKLLCSFINSRRIYAFISHLCRFSLIVRGL